MESRKPPPEILEFVLYSINFSIINYINHIGKAYKDLHPIYGSYTAEIKKFQNTCLNIINSKESPDQIFIALLTQLIKKLNNIKIEFLNNHLTANHHIRLIALLGKKILSLYQAYLQEILGQSDKNMHVQSKLKALSSLLENHDIQKGQKSLSKSSKAYDELENKLFDISDINGIALFSALKIKNLSAAKMLIVSHAIDLTIKMNGRTCLHWACQHNDGDIVAQLIHSEKFDLNQADSKGHTYLSLLCDQDNPDLRSINSLIDKGGKLDKLVTQNCYDLGYYLIQKNRLESLNFLIQKGLKLNAFYFNHAFGKCLHYEKCKKSAMPILILLHLKIHGIKENFIQFFDKAEYKNHPCRLLFHFLTENQHAQEKAILFFKEYIANQDKNDKKILPYGKTSTFQVDASNDEKKSVLYFLMATRRNQQQKNLRIPRPLLTEIINASLIDKKFINALKEAEANGTLLTLIQDTIEFAQHKLKQHSGVQLTKK